MNHCADIFYIEQSPANLRTPTPAHLEKFDRDLPSYEEVMRMTAASSRSLSGANGFPAQTIDANGRKTEVNSEQNLSDKSATSATASVYGSVTVNASNNGSPPYT